MKKLVALINDLETKIPYSERQNISVSGSSVKWHIQHSLLVCFQIIQTLERSNPDNYKWKFSLNKTLVYTLNKIPRGKAKAPESVTPKEVISVDEMKENFVLLRSRLEVFKTLHPNNYFKHPYFGDLNVKATIKMLKLHTKHHLDIINDIISD